MKKSSRVLCFKIFLAAFAVVLVLAPSTFTHVPDIEQRVVVSVLGVDAADDGYKVSAQVIIPKRATEGDPKQEVVDADGKSVSEAIDKLNRAMGRRVDLGHCGVIVVGKSLAEQGVRRELEYLFAGGIVTPGTNLICTKSEAGAFIKKAVSLAANSVTGLDSFITYASTGSHTATLTLNRFLSSTDGESNTSYMPILEIDDGGEQSEQSDGQAAQAAAQQGNEQSQTVIKSAESIAVFYDGVLCGTFDAELTRGLVWVDRKSDSGQIQLDKFEYDGKDYGGIYACLRHKKRKYCAHFDENGVPIFTVRLNVKAELQDKHTLNELADSVGIKEATKQIQDAFTAKIEKEITETYLAGLAMGADIFEVRSAFYKGQYDGYAAYGKAEFLHDVQLRFEIRVKVV